MKINLNNYLKIKKKTPPNLLHAKQQHKNNPKKETGHSGKC